MDFLILTSIKGTQEFDNFFLDILVEIKKQPLIGDRRIDLKSATHEKLASDPFLKKISMEMIRL